MANNAIKLNICILYMKICNVQYMFYWNWTWKSETEEFCEKMERGIFHICAIWDILFHSALLNARNGIPLHLANRRSKTKSPVAYVKCIYRAPRGYYIGLYYFLIASNEGFMKPNWRFPHTYLFRTWNDFLSLQHLQVNMPQRDSIRSRIASVFNISRID